MKQVHIVMCIAKGKWTNVHSVWATSDLAHECCRKENARQSDQKFVTSGYTVRGTETHKE